MRFWKKSLVAVIALALLLVFTPPPAAAAGRVFVHGWYGPGWYGPGWGWGYPGWYGAGWGYGYVPNAGKIKIDTHDKDAAVYVDGGYAGTVAKMHKFSLRPGNHEVQLRAPNGQSLYDQRVAVMRGQTTVLHVE